MDSVKLHLDHAIYESVKNEVYFKDAVISKHESLYELTIETTTP